MSTHSQSEDAKPDSGRHIGIIGGQMDFVRVPPIARSKAVQS
jgi:hypothetical protein